MYTNKSTLLIILLLQINSYAQHRLVSNTAHYSLQQTIDMNNEIIEGRTEFFEKQAEEKPLMFQKTKVMIGELNRLSTNVIKYISGIQNEVNSERVLYELLDEDHYEKVIFDYQGDLTEKGKQLKIKIDSLYNYSLRINVHRLSQLENYSEEKLKTSSDFYDHNEQKLSYFHYLFYDKTNYGMMMSMNYLLLDVQTFQLLYYGTVMNY
ncbi:hypothetical protein [Tenacibaculum agarivorans]|uniref:hypothetical protein n=1 Tax=Tenacibaculum agarivorans TaxID=1908389 RepID=UPI00094BAB05|nr:hypothetical protein [Tenacibaculum agarivorans]